jgi:pyruvate dehydrogenase E2 component (dihydrolipoamide acetyltransferase)
MIGKASPLPFSTWRKIAMATWRPRKDPMIWATADIDATNLLRYITEVRAATAYHVTPAHLVGRAAARVFQALPELNGRVAFGSFLPSPSIDCFFVVSLRTDPVSGAEAAETDLSGAVVRDIDTKPPWMIAKELADRASRIRHNDDPQFKQAKALVKNMPPMLLRPVMDCLGFVTETLQLPVPFMGVEARPYGSILVSNIGTYGLDSVSAPVPTFCHVPITVVAGAVKDKVLARDGQPVVRPVLPLTIGLDHRFVDGYQAATMARVFREYMDNPAEFDPVRPRVAPRRRQASVRSARGRKTATPARTPSAASRPQR